MTFLIATSGNWPSNIRIRHKKRIRRLAGAATIAGFSRQRRIAYASSLSLLLNAFHFQLLLESHVCLFDSAERQVVWSLVKVLVRAGVYAPHTWLPKKTNTASDAPMRKAQMLNVRPNCLMLNCLALASSTRACPVALL